MLAQYNNTCSNKRRRLDDGDGEALDEVAKLKELFFRVNTIYTFLMCRKHVIPTFETCTQCFKKRSFKIRFG